MRRKLRKLLPIVLTALMVQILAPVVACWGASMAASDPLHGAVICHSDTTSSSGSTDHSGRLPAHDGCCSLCSVAQTGAPVEKRLLSNQAAWCGWIAAQTASVPERAPWRR